MKKILLLGGSAQQIVAIETAKKLGYFTILCDYLNDNPGQFVADKFYLISTTDKDAVLEIAQKENIDGIVAYASDPAAPTAAYVSKNMGLSSNPYESVEILCNKDLFRKFLKENGFNTPRANGFSIKEEVQKDISNYKLPIIVKPVDSSGSKGATVIKDLEELDDAIDFAFSFSRSHRIIVEEFIEKAHPYLIGGDIFVNDGKIKLWGLLNCHRDMEVNPLVPVGKSYPVMLDDNCLSNVKTTLQKMVNMLHMEKGAMNVELIVDKNGGVWPIDVGPRNGGNMIPDLLGNIFGIDIVEMTIKAAMGEKLRDIIGEGNLYYATHNLHSKENGVFQSIEYSQEIRRNIISDNIYKKEGDPVEFFDNASKALGIVFLKFDTFEEMKMKLDNINNYINVILK